MGFKLHFGVDGVLSTLVGPKKMVACDRGQGSLEGVSLCLVFSGALRLEK